MKLFLNNLTEFKKKCCELGTTLICMSGYDKPKYIDARSGSAGDVGFAVWFDYTSKPTKAGNTGSDTLARGKYYSIVAVPVDHNTVEFDDYQRGTPTAPSVPAQADNGAVNGLGIRWNIPTHPQVTVYDAGNDGSGADGYLSVADAGWVIDQWNGYTAVNITTGEEFEILSNTEDAAVIDGVAAFSAGDKYNIVKPKTTHVDIYACEMSEASDLSGATFIFQGQLNLANGTTFDLDLYANIGSYPPYSNVPPEGFSYCISADNKVFAAGGVDASQIACDFVTTPEVFDAGETPINDYESTFDSDEAYTLDDSSLALSDNELVGTTMTNTTRATSGTVLSNSATRIIIDSDLGTLDTDAYEYGGGTAAGGLPEVIYNGTADSVSDGTITILASDWAEHEMTGRTIVNVTQGWETTILSNEASALHYATGLGEAGGDTFQIVWSKGDFRCSGTGVGGPPMGTISLLAPYLIPDQEVGGIIKNVTANWEHIILENGTDWIVFSDKHRIDGGDDYEVYSPVPLQTPQVIFTGVTSEGFGGYLDFGNDTFIEHEMIGRTVHNLTKDWYETVISNNHWSLTIPSGQPMDNTDNYEIIKTVGDIQLYGQCMLSNPGDITFFNVFMAPDNNIGDTIENLTQGWVAMVTGNSVENVEYEPLHQASNSDYIRITTGAGVIEIPPAAGTATADQQYRLGDSTQAWVGDELAGSDLENTTEAKTDVIISNTESHLFIATSTPTPNGDEYTINSGVVIAVPVSITKTTEYYSGSHEQQVMRYTIAAGHYFANVYVGSRLTATGSENGLDDVYDAEVLRVAPDMSWIEVANNLSLMNNPSDTSISLSIVPNLATPSVPISDVFVGASISAGGSLLGTIAWVNEDGSKFTFSELLLVGDALAVSCLLSSSNDLAWSDYGNPHVWRSENRTQISDRIVALSTFRGLLLIFCKRSVWKLPLAEITQTPTLVSSSVKISAPFSVVETPNGIMFHDGEGFSLTDGQVVHSATQFKVTNFLRGVNSDMLYNMCGVYDSVNRRVEYVFPMGNEITNNAGLYITVDSLNIYPFSRMDCNSVWEDETSEGKPIVMHGTSGRHVLSGKGTTYEHPHDMPTDGAFGESETFGSIISIGSGSVTIVTGKELTLGEGTCAMYYPPNGIGRIVQFIVKSVSGGGNTYSIEIGGDWYTTEFQVGGIIYFTMIPFEYGIKWLDFSSPQYQHKVRQIQIDVTNFIGTLCVEHYGDLIEAAIQIDSLTVGRSDTKLVIPLKKGSFYTYGFKIRGYSSTKANILSYEVLFDTEI